MSGHCGEGAICNAHIYECLGGRVGSRWEQASDPLLWEEEAGAMHVNGEGGKDADPWGPTEGGGVSDLSSHVSPFSGFGGGGEPWPGGRNPVER
jgi:hypothetical protein